MLIKLLLDLIYPPKCPVCRDRVEVHGDWCPVCLAHTVHVRRLSIPMVGLDECWALCDYTGGLKRILHDVKFRSADKFRPHFNYLLSACTFTWPLVNFVGVPVPLDSARLSMRGFNQTELIFREWLTDRCQWYDALERVRPTLPQWELGRNQRRANIRGAFQVNKNVLVAGRNILLVDDIVTSGITMAECARTLKKAGACRVIGLALASGA